jgi:hypothetical protein
MSATILVRVGRRYRKVRVNPSSDKEVNALIKKATADLIYATTGVAVRAGNHAVISGLFDMEVAESMSDASFRNILKSDMFRAGFLNDEQIMQIAMQAVKDGFPKVMHTNPSDEVSKEGRKRAYDRLVCRTMERVVSVGKAAVQNGLTEWEVLEKMADEAARHMVLSELCYYTSQVQMKRIMDAIIREARPKVWGRKS